VGERLGPERRIKKPSEFDKVFREGMSASSREMVVYAVSRTDGRPSRLGLAVGSKVGNSAERNKVKRRLRVVFRKSGGIGPVDVIAVARAGAYGMTYRDLESTFLRLIGEAVKRARSRASAPVESKKK